MMRENQRKYRGKEISSGDWVYGWYLLSVSADNNKRHQIVQEDGLTFDVDPRTIGQYTGLNDNTDWDELTQEEQDFFEEHGIDEGEWIGRDIYEGDIVRVFYFRMAVGENLGVYEVDEELTGVIEYGHYGLLVEKVTDKNGKWRKYTGFENAEGRALFVYLHDVYDESTDYEHEIQVIGKIHDQTYMLEDKDDIK